MQVGPSDVNHYRLSRKHQHRIHGNNINCRITKAPKARTKLKNSKNESLERRTVASHAQYKRPHNHKQTNYAFSTLTFSINYSVLRTTNSSSTAATEQSNNKCYKSSGSAPHNAQTSITTSQQRIQGHHPNTLLREKS